MTSPFGDIAVITDRGVVDTGPLERALDERGLAYRLLRSRDSAHTSELAAAALGEGFRYLAAAGDDRTVNDVVNGMFSQGATPDDTTVLGVIPALGPCDLTRSFGLPDDVTASVHHLDGDNTYPFDIMRVTAEGPEGRVTRYGANLAQIGLHAAAIRAADTHRWMGSRIGRFWGFWSAYAKQGVRDVRLKIDTRDRALLTWSMIIGNGQFDAGLRMSPRSYPGDGVLDVLAFVGPKAEAYRLLPRIFRHGDHVPDDGITELRIRLAARIESDRPMPVVVDGAYLGATPATVEVLPQPILFKL